MLMTEVLMKVVFAGECFWSGTGGCKYQSAVSPGLLHGTRLRSKYRTHRWQKLSVKGEGQYKDP